MEKYKVYYCPKCGINKYINLDEDFNGICKVCGKEMKRSEKDIAVQTVAPWNLKKSSEMITEYKTMEQKNKELKEAINRENMRSQQQNIPHCPICGSTKLSKISGAKKAIKIGLFGIFGAGDLGKTWKCENCGSKF